MDASVSEEHIASIFRVEVCRVRNWLLFIGQLQGRQSLRSIREEEAIELYLDKNGEKEMSP